MALRIGMPLVYRTPQGILKPGMVYEVSEDPSTIPSVVWFDDDQAQHVQFATNVVRDDDLTTGNTWAPVPIDVAAEAKFTGV